jgi:uncharacterized protein YndB with AHSA1/START domain
MMDLTRGGAAVVTLPTDTQILITREFSAPKHLIYKAWTTPELVRRWWAGRRGEVTSIEMDFRVGGTWRYVMVAHGAFEVAFHGEYREIVPNERIVTTEFYEMPGEPQTEGVLNTVTFSEAAGRTTLAILSETGSKKLRDTIMRSGMEGGVQEQMEIIEEIARALR